MIKQRWKIFKFSYISPREEKRSKIALFALPNFSSGNNEQETAKIFILVALYHINNQGIVAKFYVKQ